MSLSGCLPERLCVSERWAQVSPVLCLCEWRWDVVCVSERWGLLCVCLSGGGCCVCPLAAGPGLCSVLTAPGVTPSLLPGLVCCRA